MTEIAAPAFVKLSSMGNGSSSGSGGDGGRKIRNGMLTWMKRKRPSTIMMADGTSFKLKSPATVSDAIANHPDHVIMEPEEVKRHGVNARALHPNHPLKPKKLYFIVKLPKVQPPPPASRQVRSGINMNAKERLEKLMLSRRAVSDITFMRSTAVIEEEEGQETEEEGLRVKMRLPKSEVERLVRESGGDKTAAASKIMELCVSRETANHGVGQRSKFTGTKSGPLPQKTEVRTTNVRYLI